MLKFTLSGKCIRRSSLKFSLTHFHKHTGIIWIYLCLSLSDPEVVVGFGKVEHQPALPNTTTTSGSDKSWWCQGIGKRIKCVTKHFNEERRRHLPDNVNFNLHYSKWLHCWKLWNVLLLKNLYNNFPSAPHSTI